MENELLSLNLDFVPKLIICYVDNIFAVFLDDISCTKLFNLLNSKHKNINLLWSKTIHFLNVEIKLNETGIDTWVWRNSTHASLLLYFNRYCLLKWKSDLIFCLLTRTLTIMFQQHFVPN